MKAFQLITWPRGAATGKIFNWPTCKTCLSSLSPGDPISPQTYAYPRKCPREPRQARKLNRNMEIFTATEWLILSFFVARLPWGLFLIGLLFPQTRYNMKGKKAHILWDCSRKRANFKEGPVCLKRKSETRWRLLPISPPILNHFLQWWQNLQAKQTLLTG